MTVTISLAFTWRCPKSETTLIVRQWQSTWAKRSRRKLLNKFSKRMEVQESSIFLYKNTIFCLKNGDMISYLRFTMVKTSQISLILISGRNSPKSKSNKIYWWNWKVWKLNSKILIWFPIKCRKHTRKLKERSTLLERSMRWKEIRPLIPAINPWANSNKF